MESQALQGLVKKIFGDERTRLQFESDPDSVLAQFNLTEQEKRAVLSTHAKPGLVTDNSPQLEAALDTALPWMSAIP